MYFEDFTEGQVFETATRGLDEAAIVAFAERHDWQPFHIDPAAAKASPYGGLIASGFQTLLTAFELTLACRLWEGTGLGSPGMDAVRWHLPVRPGDRLSVRITVLETRPSRSKPDRGLVRFGHDVRRDDGETVMSYEAMVLIRRREGPG